MNEPDRHALIGRLQTVGGERDAMLVYVKHLRCFPAMGITRVKLCM